MGTIEKHLQERRESPKAAFPTVWSSSCHPFHFGTCASWLSTGVETHAVWGRYINCHATHLAERQQNQL